MNFDRSLRYANKCVCIDRPQTHADCYKNGCKRSERKVVENSRNGNQSKYTRDAHCHRLNICFIMEKDWNRTKLKRWHGRKKRTPTPSRLLQMKRVSEQTRKWHGNIYKCLKKFWIKNETKQTGNNRTKLHVLSASRLVGIKLERSVRETGLKQRQKCREREIDE